MMNMTAGKLREFLHYDPDTGIFTWLKPSARGSHIKAGNRAGSHNNKGYIQISVFGKLYKAHRLAWLYMTSKWPNDQIDHINGIVGDNSWSNLRNVTNSVNRQNSRRANRDSRTGFLGVTQRGRRYRAQIKLNGKTLILGMFDTPEVAHHAYLQTKRVIHPGCTI